MTAGSSGRPALCALPRRGVTPSRSCWAPRGAAGTCLSSGLPAAGVQGPAASQDCPPARSGCQQPSRGCGTSGFPCSWFALEPVSWDSLPTAQPSLKLIPHVAASWAGVCGNTRVG